MSTLPRELTEAQTALGKLITHLADNGTDDAERTAVLVTDVTRAYEHLRAPLADLSDEAVYRLTQILGREEVAALRGVSPQRVSNQIARYRAALTAGQVA